jgi:hypothetical protein
MAGLGAAGGASESEFFEHGRQELSQQDGADYPHDDAVFGLSHTAFHVAPQCGHQGFYDGQVYPVVGCQNVVLTHSGTHFPMMTPAMVALPLISM